MAYERVFDLKTKSFEMIDFVPVQSWATADRIHDNRFDYLSSYKDHTRPAYPLSASVLPALNHQIYSHDVTGLDAPVRTVCNSLPSGLKRNGDFTRHMLRAYTDVCKLRGEIESSRMLHRAHDRLTKNGYSAAMSDDDIRQLADNKSKQFGRVIANLPDVESQFESCVELLASLGLGFREEAIKKAESNNELHSLVARAIDNNWLVRQLRRKCAYEVEQVARDLALVERHKQIYCSDFSVRRHRDRMKSNEIALDKTVAFDENDPQTFFTLSELSAKSVSNPELRRNEMFARLNGFENIAKKSDHDAVFYTVTTPSRFHAVSGGVTNPNWEKAGRPDAKQSHDHLIGVWSSLRKILDKNNIKIYGMRIVEPHQDGTAHHHMLLFMEKEHRAFVTSEFNRLALADTPNESGAKKYRFKSELIDFSKGSAVGYVAKYVSKNVDGKHIDKDRSSNLDGIAAAERVVTWARVNRIRQFQFIGGASVTVWRELRRLREELNEEDAMFSDLNNEEHLTLENVRRAADAGDWEAFCYAMGGVFVKRKDQTVKAAYEVTNTIEKLIESGGEYSTTRYGDAAQARISGLMFRDVLVITRFKSWKVENKDKFIASQQKIMSGTVDWFDALEREKEYEYMLDSQYEQYEKHLARMDEIEALVLFGSLEPHGACSVGAAPPDTFH
ncbi:replication endonuclease [Vibrio kanaloae]|uniref:replication endonuclease n=1 Tax=Vibrio kanaloae TaxID=170673 RepID=UPI0010BCFE64|nr:replication endonuclease [Vibrio kanaloae]TKF05624.1 replication endonuclease [Vibrio kanaloae]TKF54651.1 replication endonuclease [Vibrio kanaloae]